MITIASTTVTVNRVASRVEARLYFNRMWKSASGKYHGAYASQLIFDQPSYLRFPCEVSGNVATIPEITIDPTTNALIGSDVRCGFAIFDSRTGRILTVIANGFQIPDSPSETTWPEIVIFQIPEGTPTGIPAVPVLSESSSGANVHLAALATTNVKQYKVYRDKNGAGFALLTTISVRLGSALSYHDTDVAINDVVNYKVKASNVIGDSAFSNIVNDTIATPVDPLTLSPLVWIDAEPAGHTAGDSIATIADQSSNADNITMNGQNCIYRTSPIKYFENQTEEGRFTLSTRLTNVRHLIMVYRFRVGAEQYLGGLNQGLMADSVTPSDSAFGGPAIEHLLVELMSRPPNPFAAGLDAGLLGTGATIRFNGGAALPKLPQVGGWETGGTWIKTAPQYAASRDYNFVILSIKTSSNISVDTLLNRYGIPHSGVMADLAAFGAFSSTLSSANEAGVVAFLKSRYALSSSPEQHLYLGDSMTYGAGLAGGNGIYNLPTVTEIDNHSHGLLSGAINLGIGSAPLSTATASPDTGLYYWYRNYLKQLRDPKRSKQLIILWVGANDIAFGSTGATLYTNVTNFCNEAHADGFKVLVISAPPSQFTPGGYDLTNYATQRAAYNSAMDADHSFADGWLNYSANTQIGVDSAYFDHPENFADGIHLNRFGYAILGPLVGTAIRAIP